MVYESFEQLNKQYPNRNEMSFEEELMYVGDCFDTYENIGFKDAFSSPYSENKTYNGRRFSVVRRVSYVEDDADIEVLPMWWIAFEDGTELEAYPEEICSSA